MRVEIWEPRSGTKQSRQSCSLRTSGRQKIRVFADKIFPTYSYDVVLAHDKDEPELSTGFFHCSSCKVCVNFGENGEDCEESDNENEIAQFLECDTPPGQGTGLAVIIRKLGKRAPGDESPRVLLQSDTLTASKVDYAPPAFVLNEGSGLALSPPGGSTTGGIILTLHCQNCGSPSLAFANRLIPAESSGQQESYSEPTIFIGGNKCFPVVEWKNDSISCVVPPGIGNEKVSLRIGGQSAVESYKSCAPSSQEQIVNPDDVYFAYKRPVIETIQIFNPQDEIYQRNQMEKDGMFGGSIVHIHGSEFGESITDSSPRLIDPMSELCICDEKCTILHWGRTNITVSRPN